MNNNNYYRSIGDSDNIPSDSEIFEQIKDIQVRILQSNLKIKKVTIDGIEYFNVPHSDYWTLKPLEGLLLDNEFNSLGSLAYGYQEGELIPDGVLKAAEEAKAKLEQHFDNEFGDFIGKKPKNSFNAMEIVRKHRGIISGFKPEVSIIPTEVSSFSRMYQAKFSAIALLNAYPPEITSDTKKFEGLLEVSYLSKDSPYNERAKNFMAYYWASRSIGIATAAFVNYGLKVFRANANKDKQFNSGGMNYEFHTFRLYKSSHYLKMVVLNSENLQERFNSAVNAMRLEYSINQFKYENKQLNMKEISSIGAANFFSYDNTLISMPSKMFMYFQSKLLEARNDIVYKPLSTNHLIEFMPPVPASSNQTIIVPLSAWDFTGLSTIEKKGGERERILDILRKIYEENPSNKVSKPELKKHLTLREIAECKLNGLLTKDDNNIFSIVDIQELKAKNEEEFLIF